MCGCPVSDRGGPGGIHEVDLHRLHEEGGDQSQDVCGLVLHAQERKKRPSQQDSCRFQLCDCMI